MALAIDITDGCGLNNEACRELLQGNAVFGHKSSLTSCTLLTRWNTSVLKVGVP